MGATTEVQVVQVSHAHHPEGDQDGQVGRAVQDMRHIGLEGLVPLDHLAGGVGDQPGAKVDEEWKAVHRLHDQRTAEDHQRDGQGQPEAQQGVVPLGHSGDSQRVVQAHHHVGDEDGLHRGDQAVLAVGVLADLRVRLDQQLVGDPDEQESTDELQEWHFEQGYSHHGQQDAQHHGPSATPEDGGLLLRDGQAARGHRDNHGVIAAKHNVNHHDFKKGGEEGEVNSFHVGVFSGHVRSASARGQYDTGRRLAGARFLG